MPSHWGYLAIPAAALVAFGFAAVGMALTSYAESMQQLNWVSFWLLPMFLFSGAFFPLDGYPWAAQQVIHALPLWQAIAMLRALMYGQLDVALLGHVAYFVVFVLVGVAFTTKRLNALFLR
jgi:lipooligosaccharide transport system permease protein